MTNPRYALLKLGAKTQSWNNVGPGEFTPSEIAFGRAGLPEINDRLIDWWWLERKESLPRLKLLSLVECAALPAIRDRTVPIDQRKGMLSKIIDSVLYEMSPKKTCPVCEGRGAILNSKKKLEQCRRCGGQCFVMSIEDRDRAKWLGKANHQYKQYWRGQYEAIYGMYWDLANHAYNHINKRLRTVQLCGK